MYAKLSILFLSGIIISLFTLSCSEESGVQPPSSSSEASIPSSSSSVVSQPSSSSIAPSSSSAAPSSSSECDVGAAPCGSPSSSSSATQSSSSGEASPPSLTGKDAIDAEIEANWQRLGYSSKPAKAIALSFDDGPCDKTQGLLDALAEKEVKTTFFLIGQNIRSNKAAAQAIYNAGHELANHSDGYSANPNQTNVQACSDEIKKITGSNPLLFRAPNVDYGSGAVDKVCQDLNLPMIDVSCWSNDYSGISSSQIRNNVKGCAKDGAIVNLHEFNTASGNDAAGIEALIDDLRAAGFWILPVGQMAVYKGKTLEGGKKYSSF